MADTAVKRSEQEELCVRSSKPEWSIRHAVGILQRDAGNLPLVYTSTTVWFQETIGVRKRVLLRGVSLEKLKSTENGASTDAVSCDREETFDELHRYRYDHARVSLELSRILEFKKSKNAHCANQYGPTEIYQ